MADNTQAASTLAAHQAHTFGATDVSHADTEVDVRTWMSAQVYVYHANITTTPNVTGVQYKIQGRWSTGATVNEDWVDLITFYSAASTAAAAEITGAEAPGETSIAVDANPTADFLSGIEIYAEDKGAVGDGEWARCSHSATAADIVNLVDGLTVAKGAADTLWTQAETFTGYLRLDGLSYVRLLMLHTGATGSSIHFKAEMVSVTDFE